MTNSSEFGATWRKPEPGGYWVDGPFDAVVDDDVVPGEVLGGAAIAVKDNIAVAGRVVGNGNPAFAARAHPSSVTAAAVAALVAAGAFVRGRVVADEFAYSLMGVNAHLGTPRNARWPSAVPGGSSSGCAAAVAAGAAALGVGTDTGGSIRVPASYCGLVGFRPTHGRIDVAGVTPLSPSFDTVGLLARADDLGLLVAAARHILSPPPTPATEVRGVVIALDLMAAASPVISAAMHDAAHALARELGVPVVGRDVLPCSIDEVRATFGAIQGFEAWQALGDVVGPLDRNPLALAPDIIDRFRLAASFTPADVARATPVRDAVRDAFDAATADGWIVVQPAAFGAPPDRNGSNQDLAAARLGSLALTAPAGLAGAPVVVVPVAPPDDPPLGVAFVGGRGQDEALLTAVRVPGASAR